MTNTNTDDKIETSVENEMDEFTVQVLEYAVSCGQISPTAIQLKFNIGYPRAIKILQKLEKFQYISKSDNNKSRQVLLSKAEFELKCKKLGRVITNKLACISLGCDKNRVDTEYILAKVSKMSIDITQDILNSDYILINTCAFLESSRKEAIDTILQVISEKQPHQKLIVSGCLPKLYIDEIIDELPEVDAFLSTVGYNQIQEAIRTIDEGKRYIFRETDLPNECQTERVLTTPEHYAYLKISDGCDNKCTYCMIPKIRGSYHSYAKDKLIAESKTLVDGGVKELILVAQDLTVYGKDLDNGENLVDLISEIENTDVEWIRLLYCYPEKITDALIDKIANSSKVVKYIDIPLQHISDKITKLMGRKTSYALICELIEKLKKKGIAIRTTFIIGFPGESQRDFEILYAFLDKYELDNVGFFAYSDEDVPSSKLKGKVSAEVTAERIQKLYALTTKILERKNSERIGKVYRVLCDGCDLEKGSFYGRCEFMSPDIDQVVYFSGNNIMQGEFYEVLIEKSCGIDLVGTIIDA